MNRYLILLRHAEAEREDADGDINRPLTPQGIKSVGLLGDNLRSRGEHVQRLCSSTATRAAQTARGVCSYLGYGENDIVWQPDLYLAGLSDLLGFLAVCSDTCDSLLLVGHNPGLQNLMTYLATPGSLPVDKSLGTATAAKLEIAGTWRTLNPECAKLIYLQKASV